MKTTLIYNYKKYKIPSRVVGYFFNFLASIRNFLPDTFIVIKTGAGFGAGKTEPLVASSLEDERATSSPFSLELGRDRARSGAVRTLDVLDEKKSENNANIRILKLLRITLVENFLFSSCNYFYCLLWI